MPRTAILPTILFALALTLTLALPACSDDSTDPPPKQDGAVADLTPEPDSLVPDLTPAADAALYPVPTAYWTMDSADIAGGILADQVGDTDGTVEGAAAEPQGRVGEALVLDGVDDHLDFDDSLDEVFAGPDKVFSIGMWVRPDTVEKNMMLVTKNADNTCDPDEDQRAFFTSVMQGGRVSMGFQPITSGSPQVVSTTTTGLTAGSWTHLLFVYDGAPTSGPGDRVTIYLDGFEVESLGQSLGSAFPFDLADNTAHLGFGVRLSSAGQPCAESGGVFFEGAVDELAIWNQGLTEQQIRDIYQRGVDGLPLVTP